VILRDESLVCLSTVDWDFLWGRHQELMSRFAGNGIRVLYVEPLGIRSARFQDFPRIIKRLQNRLRPGSRGLRSPIPNLYIHSPLALPFQSPGWVQRFNDWLLSRSILPLLQRLELSRPILWTFYATQTALDLIGAVDHRLLIYDCIDDIANNPKGIAPGYQELERQLVIQADIVFATSAALAHERESLNPHVYHIPPGVHPERFARAHPIPGDIVTIPRPRLGFYGGLDERVDQDLIAYIAQARPGWHVVFIGNVRTEADALRPHKNVHFLGQKKPDELAPYLHALDVLLIPYVVNQYTKYIYPNKVFECLAVGKPTVATPLPELLGFDGLIQLAESPDAFLIAIEAALAEDDLELVMRRRGVARANTWEVRYHQIINCIETRGTEKACGSQSSTIG
jgi:glycosyltransferase involved in cell wall biosynthesis